LARWMVEIGQKSSIEFMIKDVIAACLNAYTAQPKFEDYKEKAKNVSIAIFSSLDFAPVSFYAKHKDLVHVGETILHQFVLESRGEVIDIGRFPAAVLPHVQTLKDRPKSSVAKNTTKPKGSSKGVSKGGTSKGTGKDHKSVKADNAMKKKYVSKEQWEALANSAEVKSDPKTLMCRFWVGCRERNSGCPYSHDPKSSFVAQEDHCSVEVYRKWKSNRSGDKERPDKVEK